ncbi:MAG: prolyl oligopeptidase family serine peptidase [Alphaproteobacteria bacterium]
MKTQLVDNVYNGIFIRYTLNGSVANSPNSEVLGVLIKGSNGELGCRELVTAKPDHIHLSNLDNHVQDPFFFDSASKQLSFSIRYGVIGTADKEVLQEFSLCVQDKNIEHTATTVFETHGTERVLRSFEHAQGKISSYEVLRGGALCFYFRSTKGTLKEICRHDVNSHTVFMLALMSGQTKHIYKCEVDAKTDLASLYWLSPSKCRFKPTNFKNQFCSLCPLINDNVIFVDPTNPRNILGYLTNNKGLVKPVWMNDATRNLFLAAEAALRAKLQESNKLFRDAVFSYKAISTIISSDFIYASCEALGFQRLLSFAYGTCIGIRFLCDDSGLISDKKAYDHEFVEASSSIKDEEDTTVHYSVFKRTEAAGGVDNTKKTLVHIPGGPWSYFHTNFIEEYQSFIDDGYTIIVPHEPMRDGFGYKYMLAEKQLGRRNLNHIMNILDDASKKGTNSQMVLMGTSYGGWVASALAATWKEFKPTGSSIELLACIAQAAGLNLSDWKEKTLKYGTGVSSTFADNPVDVSGITELQAPLLIFHGTGDVRCPIESIKKWAEALKEANQPFAFFTAPEGHDGILKPSTACNAQKYSLYQNIVRRFFGGNGADEECQLRQNIVRRFIEGNTIPATSVEKLAEFSLSVQHDNLGLFKSPTSFLSVIYDCAVPA